jgi:hypothetical protein
MSTVDRSIGSLQAFEGRANRVEGAAEGVEAEGTGGVVGTARAKAKREESYWTTCKNREYLVKSSSCAARRFLIVPDKLYRKAAILQLFDHL